MSDEQKIKLLLTFFKALSDETRLQIVALLMKRPSTVEQLAEMLGVSAPTVSHHLKRLSAAGLVSATVEQYYHVYSLKSDILRDMATQIHDGAIIAEAAASADENAYDRKVVKDYFESGRLKIIPSQRKKRDIILRYLVDRFDMGRRYTEKEMNETLSQFHEDVATLRREFIACQLMARENGVYWRL